MRKIDKIIIHCSATPEGRHVGVAEIRSWHLARGFSDIGYHYIIGIDGSVWPGRPLEQQGAHCLGQNARSIGVCYVGGLAPDCKTPLDTRTPAQKSALKKLVASLLSQYPGATVHGHREFAAKACPCFEVSEEF